MAAGAAVDIVASSVLQAALAVVAGIDLSDERLAETLLATPMLFAVWFGLGTVASVAGGYVSARLAAGAELENAFTSGIAVAILGLVLSVTTSSPPPLWLVIAGAFATVAAQTFGGWLRLKTLPPQP